MLSQFFLDSLAIGYFDTIGNMCRIVAILVDSRVIKRIKHNLVLKYA